MAEIQTGIHVYVNEAGEHVTPPVIVMTEDATSVTYAAVRWVTGTDQAEFIAGSEQTFPKNLTGLSISDLYRFRAGDGQLDKISD